MKIIKLIIILLVYKSAFGQNNSIISGTTKQIKFGKVYIVGIGTSKKYYGKNSFLDSAEISNGKFKIKKKIFDNEIRAYRFVFRSQKINGVTDFVFIDKKDIVVIIDSIDLYRAPLIKSSMIQNEMRFNYNSFFKNFVVQIKHQTDFEDSLNLIYIDNFPDSIKFKLNFLRNKILLESDSLIYSYSKNHPNSYVTLWKLIERFYELGYNDVYLKVFNLLNIKIRSSSLGKLFYSDLKKSEILKLERLFPQLSVKNIYGSKHIFKPLSSKYDFTLIDFWFSNCSPCLKDFPSYKRIYKSYHKEGFEVIGLSVDKEINVANWKKTIKNRQLPWPQFLDPNGYVSSGYNINSFPTNFLLNKQGKIIRINISSIELEDLLKENLIKNDINDNIPKLEPD